MIGTIIMQRCAALGEVNNDYIVIPVLYNEEGKLVETPKELYSKKKAFKFFEDAVRYSNILKGSM